MADIYLEYDYLSKKKQRRRALRKRPRWPFVLLGFFIGFVTLPALIALGVLLFVNRPVEKTVNSIDKITNAGLYETLFGTDDKVGILNDRYGEMALKDALGDIVKIAEKGGKLTFQDLTEISPQVEKSVDDLIEAAEEKSIILDKQEMMTTPLTQFGDLLMDEVKEIELGEVLLSTKSDIFSDDSTGAILKNLFFGKAGINYTELEGKITMLPISYEYDDATNTFVCVDETVYAYNDGVWAAENGQYIASADGGYALYSSSGDVVYHLNVSPEKDLTTYIAVTLKENGSFEPIKQKSLALGDFMEKGSNPMDIIGKLELGTLLGITTKGQAEAEGNGMLVSLAYGTYGEDFYYDGEQDSSLIIPKKGGKPFTTLNDLMGSPDEILNGMKLGSLLGITTHAEAIKESNSMLVALAYGTYGVDFKYACNEIECNDTSCTKPDCTVVKIDTSDRAFTTLNDLMTKSDEVLNGIRLGTLLGITTKGDIESGKNDMMVAIAYGTYGTDFDYDGDSDDSLIVPVGGKQFTTLGDLINKPDTVLNSIQLGSLLGITTHADSINDNNKMLVALAYGTYGTDYIFACDGTECTDNSNCIVVRKETSNREFTTLGDLMNNSDTVLNNIRLGTLLGITTKGDIESGKNDMMVAIAYGTYGTDFDYDGDSDDSLIVPVGGKQFTTLGDLINKPDDILSGIQLGSLLGITTHADAINDNNKMLVALAYGTYGTDYIFACDGTECTDNSNCIVVRKETSNREFTTLNDLMNNSDTVLNNIRLGTLLGITTKGDIESGKNDMMVAIAYGTYGTDFDYDGDSDDGLIVPVGGKQFTTLGDLINKPDDILSGIQLGSLLGITTHADAINDNNKMLVALAYGTYGTDYIFACDGTECTDNSNCIVVRKETSNREFTTLNDLMNNSDEVLNSIPLGTLLGITTQTDVESGDNDMMVAIAYGTYDVDFTYDANGNIVSKTGEPFTTLGDLIHDPNGVLQTIQLGSLLGITTKDHIEGNAEKDIQAADTLLVSIAYGTYDVDFIYDEKDKIVPKAGGKPFTTVENLMNSDEAEEIFKNIPLSSIFAVDIFAADADPLTISLVYGTEGKHYVISYDDNNQPFVDWQIKDPATGEKYKERTFGELRDGDLTDLVNDLKVSDVFEIVEEGENASPKLLISIKDWNISDLSDPTKIKGLTIEEVMDIDENDNFLNAIKSWPIGEIGEDRIKDVTIGEVITIDQDGDAFLKAISTWKIGDISQNKVKELQLKDVLGEQTQAGLLQTIVNKTNDNGDPWTIGDLTETNIQSLQLKDVLPIKDGDKILEIMGDWTISEINDDQIKTIPLSSIFSVNDSDTGLLATLVKKTKDRLDEENNVVYDEDGNPIQDPWTIADLTESNIQSLTLKEVLPSAIGASENDFFGALADTPLSKLNAEYIKEKLTIGQALGITNDNQSDYGILLQFKDTKIQDFNETLLKSTLTIGDVVSTDHPILDALKDKTLNEINKDLIQSELEKLKLSQVIELEDGEKLHPIFQTLQDKTLGEITKGNVIDGITVGKAIGLESTDDPILGQIIDLTLGNLKDTSILKNRINGLKLNQLITIGSDDKFLKEMGNWTIGNITEDQIKTVKLSSIFSVDSDDTGLLATLVKKEDAQGNAWTIAHLTSDNINGLTLSEVLGESNVNGNFYLKHLSGSTLGTLASDIQNISVLDLFADTMEYKKDTDGNILKDENGHPVITGTWKYLLTWNWDETNADAPNKTYVAPEDYKVSDMAAMIENMHNNIEHATLQDLHDDNMMPHLGNDMLQTPLIYQIKKSGGVLVDFTADVKDILGSDYEIKDDNADGKLDDKTIGCLNVLEVAQYLNYLLSAISSIT